MYSIDYRTFYRFFFFTKVIFIFFIQHSFLHFNFLFLNVFRDFLLLHFYTPFCTVSYCLKQKILFFFFVVFVFNFYFFYFSVYFFFFYKKIKTWFFILLFLNYFLFFYFFCTLFFTMYLNVFLFNLTIKIKMIHSDAFT